MWNSDPAWTDPTGQYRPVTDPIYQSHPFFLSLRKGGRATGALLVSNRPFGFVALLGMVALTGMIMRNTVILVDQIDHNIAAGQARSDAIVDATVGRSRPMLLTALASILGMIPLSGSVFWGPMAITIMGGLLAATLLTLITVPAAYALWISGGPDTPTA